MTKRVLMHVGLGKTGTTTIQRTLAQYRRRLRGLGISYPGTSEAHHDLLGFAHQVGPQHFWFTDRQLDLSEARALGLVARDELEDAMHNESPVVLLSSEYFHSLNVEKLQEFDQYCASFGYRFEVLCFIREPVSHMASRIQQSVKMGFITIREGLQMPYQPWALGAFRRSRNALGGERVHGLKMEEAQSDGLARAVLRVAGLAPECGEFEDLSSNIGLSSDGVYLADALNRFEKGERRRFGRALSTIRGMKGPRFTLPPEVALRVIEEASGEQAWLKKHFGLYYDPVEPQPSPSPEARMAWADEQIIKMNWTSEDVISLVNQKSHGARGLLQRLRVRSG